MAKKLSTNEAAAIATDEALGASNLFETVAGEDHSESERGKFTFNPYRSDFEERAVADFLVKDPDGHPLCFCVDEETAKRIAYCLNIVAESEESDRRRG